MSESRIPTELDAIAERWVDTLCALDPDYGVYLGRAAGLEHYGDLSPEGHAAKAEVVAHTLSEVRGAMPRDDVDRVTQADMIRDLELQLEIHESGWFRRDLNVIASPAQGIRDILDLLPMSTVDDWRLVATRFADVPRALAGYTQTLRSGITTADMPARRQIAEAIVQARRNAGPDGFFDSLSTTAEPEESTMPESLRADLVRGATAARDAYLAFATFLETELAPASHDTDAVGRDVYALHSRYFVGATVDLDETYEWGLDELRRMIDEQEDIAREIVPGGGIAAAVAALDQDPARKIHGTDALRAWMQNLTDVAVRELGHSHFDITTDMRKIECMIAPTKDGGIYYTSPSDDFSRPGRMWWSVPEGVTEFDTWREATTVYHEGVPGHHLQIAQAVANSAELNTWRRQLAGSSGHAEGWALYAERLMEELGYLSDAGDRFGMLDAQRMRAARVVLDIGIHLGKPRPDGHGIWDAAYAFDFMRGNVLMEDEFVRFEVNRYLGWPGQAPSYKIGQRMWETLRAESAAQAGDDFNVMAWHKRALNIGGVGLDTLRKAIHNQW